MESDRQNRTQSRVIRIQRKKRYFLTTVMAVAFSFLITKALYKKERSLAHSETEIKKQFKN